MSQMETEELTRPTADVQDEQLSTEDRKTATILQTNKRNPPARNTSRFWFERFLSVIQRQNPSVIEANFVSQIAPSNEGKLLAQLKFLHVIDEQGKPTPVLPMLNMVGEEQRRAFQEIARSSYGDLFSELKVEKALPDDLVNFFIRKYSFTRDKAVNAAKFFLYLAEKGGITVSADLSAFVSEKNSAVVTSSQQSIVSAPLGKTQQLQRELRNGFANGTPRISQAKEKRARILEFTQDALPAKLQATVNIVLDKDTPKEYWDRVLALLGEQKSEMNGKPSVAIPSEEENFNEGNRTE
jgi:Family of unknown function (DUF5343)